jgi:hypothetical protein
MILLPRAGLALLSSEELILLRQLDEPYLKTPFYGSRKIIELLTSNPFTACLKVAEVKIGMDGRGRYLENISVQRLWRPLNYELVYIKAFDAGKPLIQTVKEWFCWYNNGTDYQVLGYQKPEQVNVKSLSSAEVA